MPRRVIDVPQRMLTDSDLMMLKSVSNVMSDGILSNRKARAMLRDRMELPGEAVTVYNLHRSRTTVDFAHAHRVFRKIAEATEYEEVRSEALKAAERVLRIRDRVDRSHPEWSGHRRQRRTDNVDVKSGLV